MMRNLHAMLSNSQRATHVYVIGQPGTGKSRAIESWVMQDVLAGRGVGVIDPHGDLFNNLMARLANHPAVWPRIVIIDPCDPQWVVGINPLESLTGYPTDRIAQFMTDIIAKIWRLETAQTPRLLWLMSNSFLALAEAGLGLLDLPRFLLDAQFRETAMPRIKNQLVRGYFEHEYPRSQAAVHQWATPLLNKIGALLFDSDVRLMLAANPPLDFQALMDKSTILLVNIPKGILGEGTSALLGAFIVARIQKAALGRTGQAHRTQFYLYLDEFQNYTTSNIVDILAESRKYALSMTLAHQYLDQLSPEIRNAVLNTAGTLISFRVGHEDAIHMAKEMFGTTGGVSQLKINLEQSDLWPKFSLRRADQPLSHERFAQLLTGLRPREFWAKKRGLSHATRHHTISMPDVRMTDPLAARLQKIRSISGMRYGKPKSTVRRANAMPEDVQPDHTAGFWSS